MRVGTYFASFINHKTLDLSVSVVCVCVESLIQGINKHNIKNIGLLLQIKEIHLG